MTVLLFAAVGSLLLQLAAIGLHLLSVAGVLFVMVVGCRFLSERKKRGQHVESSWSSCQKRSNSSGHKTTYFWVSFIACRLDRLAPSCTREPYASGSLWTTWENKLWLPSGGGAIVKKKERTVYCNSDRSLKIMTKFRSEERISRTETSQPSYQNTVEIYRTSVKKRHSNAQRSNRDK